MLNQDRHNVIVLDSETALPINRRGVYPDQTTHRFSDETPDRDRIQGETVPTDSPESRAAHPELKSKALVLLMLSVLFVVLIAAGVVTYIWGIAAGALVLVFGSGLLFLGNPEIWATTQRAKERSETND